MNKQTKMTLVSDIKGLMSGAQATFLVNYKGLNVAAFQNLRKTVRSQGGSVKVTKATLMRIAAQDIPGSDSFAENFKEQVGLVFANNDVSTVAKQLVNFSKEHAALKVVAGFYEARLLSKAELEFLATLPSKEALVGLFAATLQAPISGLARILKAVEEKQQTPE